MCLLSYFPAGVLPDAGALRNGAVFNDDGHGFAIVTDDHMIVEHDMDAELMIATFETLRRRYPQGPALFHSRFATHGTRSLANCHPFPVGGDPCTVLAHNGVLPALVQPTDGDPRSDTRIVAEDFLPLFGPLRTRAARLRLQRWMRPTNKMVILTVDRRFRQRAYILNEDAGIWDGGIWYSNDGYLPTRWAGPRANADPWDWPQWTTSDHVADRCWFCYSIIDITDHRCRVCGWCTGCGEMPEHCLCYTPATLDRQLATGT